MDSALLTTAPRDQGQEKKMTKKGDLTREQAIALVGIEAVERAENENCEPTGRVGYNGSCQGDDLIEWSASAGCEDKEGYECSVIAYYYTDEEDEDAAEANGWDSIDWEIAGYEVI